MTRERAADAPVACPTCRAEIPLHEIRRQLEEFINGPFNAEVSAALDVVQATVDCSKVQKG